MAENAFDIAKEKNTVQYSNSSLKTLDTVTVNSTVPTKEVLTSITDLIPNADYNPWYAKQLRILGYPRFMYLVSKARAGSDTPAILFKWMLENNGIVK